MGKYPPRWDRKDGSDALWIDHATLVDGDLQRFEGVRRLTAWNVKFPPGFLARIPGLWWLDLRGGSASDITVIDGLEGLRGLSVNQVRGLADLGAIERLGRLEFLDLYGLSRVESLPRLEQLLSLRRIQLGQLRSLRDWRPLAAAPALEELLFVNKLYPDDGIVAALAAHPTLRTFGWFAPDEPDRVVASVVKRIDRLPVRMMDSEDWFSEVP